MISLFPYDLSLMISLAPSRTGVAGAMMYCDRPNDDGCIIISIGKRWGATDKAFAVVYKGCTKGRWLHVKGSVYQTEQDVPVGYVRAVRDFANLNADLLHEWVNYEGIELCDSDFVLRVKRVR